MTTLAPEPTATGEDAGDDVTHCACPCYPDVSLCGEDVSGLEWARDGEELTVCVVCADLAELSCPRCGE